jgi:hypothetical protein
LLYFLTVITTIAIQLEQFEHDLGLAHMELPAAPDATDAQVHARLGGKVGARHLELLLEHTVAEILLEWRAAKVTMQLRIGVHTA